MRQTIFLLNTILFVGQIFAQSISEPGGLHCNQPLIALPPIDVYIAIFRDSLGTILTKKLIVL